MQQQQTPTVTEQTRQIHKQNMPTEKSTTSKDIEKKDVSMSLSASQGVSQHSIKRELHATYSKVASIDGDDVMTKSTTMQQQQTPTATEQMRQIHKQNISIEKSTTPKDIEKKDVSVSLSASQEVSQHSIKRELHHTYSTVASLDRDDVMTKSSFINDVLEKEIISKIVEIDKRFSFEIIHVGSYYEGLEVGEADEFDHDIMVKLNADKISKIFKINVCPARRHSDLVGFAYLEYQSHFDGDRNWRDLLMEGPNNRLVLSPELILKRFESLLSQRLHKMNSLKKRHWKESPVLTLHGPAVKITFRLFNGKPLDIDVVLCLESAEWPLVANSWGTLHLPKWPSKAKVDQIKKKGCHVVPKVHSSDDRCWRLSFSVAEKSLLYRKAIDEDKKYYRIVKLIFVRYKGILEPLCSYHLKTLLLHKRTNGPPMSGDIEVVEYFIEQLIEKVRTRALPHYFIGHTLNLFNEMSDTQASEIINCFTKTFGDRTTMKFVKNFRRKLMKK